MSVSSFLVVMNALRLNLYNPQKIRVNENKSFQNTANNVKLIEDIRTGKQMNTLTVKINGMMCPHCSGRVKTLLEAKECVTLADVSHERGDAVITLSSEPTDSVISELKKIINDAGYETP